MAVDEHQRRRDGSFKDAEKDAGDKEGVIAMGCGGAGGRDAPENNIEREPFRNGNLLKDQSLICQLENRLGSSIVWRGRLRIPFGTSATR